MINVLQSTQNHHAKSSYEQKQYIKMNLNLSQIESEFELKSKQ